MRESRLPTMPRRILLIDDDQDLRRLAQMRLQLAGYEVLEAGDGEEGLRLLHAERPPVILLDLMMPKMHGYTVCQQIRNDPALQHTFIIATSAKRYPVDIRKAMEMGANAYLVKPYEIDEMLQRVAEGFAASESPAESAKKHAAFSVRFWGTRGSIATPGSKTLRYGGNTSCVEVRHGNRILMLDCGTGARELGISLQHEFGDKPLELDLFVSHTHWDHIQGFPFFTPAYLPGTHLRIYSLHGTDKSLHKVFTGQMDGSYFPVELGELQSKLEFLELGGGPLELGDIRVTHFGLNHPGLAVAYRFEAAGKSLVYLTDHEPYCRHSGENDLNKRLDREVDDFVNGADLYIREAQYTEEEYERKRGWGHATWKDAMDSAHAAGVKRICLYHHDPMHDDIALDAILSACWEYMKRNNMKFECVMATDTMELSI